MPDVMRFIIIKIVLFQVFDKFEILKFNYYEDLKFFEISPNGKTSI